MPSAIYRALGKENKQKNKKSLPSARDRALGKENKQKIKKNKKIRCRVSDGDHSVKPNGGWPPSPRLAFAECLALPRARHSAKGGFAECYPLPNAWHSAKKDMPSVWLCRVRHSAKSIFAECPTFGTRQSRKHSAKPLFP